MNDTDLLIASLSEGLQPVKRLPPPGQRAAVWLGVIALLSVILVLRLSNMAIFMQRVQAPMLVVEMAGTLATGILAVFAAFQLSLPDRSWKWIFLPLPTLLLWICSSGYSCWLDEFIPTPYRYGVVDSPRSCFGWIVGFGIPLAISLFVFLRRSQPLSPAPVAAMAGLGVASIAAFVLQFVHPFDVTFIDLGVHLAAVGSVILLARAAAERGLGVGPG